jgi:hypothetical protein
VLKFRVLHDKVPSNTAVTLELAVIVLRLVQLDVHNITAVSLNSLSSVLDEAATHIKTNLQSNTVH